MKTAFVADSTLGLSRSEALERGIHLVPAVVILNSQSLRDYLEVTPTQIVQAMREGKKLSTSHTSPAEFQALYEKLLGEHDRILCVHASSKLSGFVSTARMVAQQFAGRVQVLDSMTVNAGLGYVLEEARRRLAKGVSWENLEQAIAPYRASLLSLVLPQTLEYLRRGGRISGLQFFLGSFLRLLPILEFKEGLVKPVERVRSFHRGMEQMAERFHKAFPAGARITLAHSENYPAMEELARLIRSEGVLLEGTRPAGAAVTVHAGPGTVALFAAPRSHTEALKSRT